MSDSSGLSVNGPETLRGSVAFLLVGLCLTGYGAFDYVQQSDSIRDSVEVEATITEVGVEPVSGSSSSTSVSYEPRVRFTYTYRGQSHTGTNLYPADIPPNFETRSAAETAVQKYETGQEITAYVDPDDPGNAFLQNESSSAPLIAVGIGVVLTLLGSAATLKQYRSG
ncbi:DUF3592 domain-containing protein [Halomicroarcula sp. GCM10025817]|uniref:DUF3592 domain-containing protein n=1 Tax=Haloarcula TaxID=2237 RepID=UPI0023E7D660|nr:DUF3592 domain-containing protein [Halomicroarcula sp. SYNS111]